MDVDRLDDRTPRRVEGDGRAAAVLVPIIDRNRHGSLLFTKRSELLGDHPGQMSFPGGGREPGDNDLYETALREADEEIGLKSKEVDTIGRLDEIRTVSEYVVTPFVVRIPDREYTPDGHEVVEVTILPVRALCEPVNYERVWRTRPDGTGRWVHYFRVDGYTVWGATGRILAQLLELTTDWQPSESEP